MENYDIVYAVCLGKKNINVLLQIICDDIKLSERSIPKCANMIKIIMGEKILKICLDSQKIKTN